jgi:hypothetical protein
MSSPLRNRFALLVAGLGLSAAVAAAAPPDKGTPPAKSTPPAKAELPSDLPKTDLKPAAIPSHLDHKPILLPPKVDLKPDPKPVIQPAPPPTVFPRITPTPTRPALPPEVKFPAKPDFRPLVIHEKSKTGGPVELPKGPALKLAAGTKIDHAELAKIKPPVDLTKTKPEVVLASKPPADFKMKPIKLDAIHVPHDAPVMEKLSVANVTKLTVNQTFVLNKTCYTGGDYHLKYGTKTAFGYCYPGKHHCHWHHCIWDPCFGCYYYFCPSTCCYYYWCEADYCYYPCYWFVDYGTCYYPWWLCGGFGGYGYVADPHVSIFIGW